MLEWNKAKVRNPTGAEIWLMIVGRVLAGFGLGILACSLLSASCKLTGFPCSGAWANPTGDCSERLVPVNDGDNLISSIGA
jgi:hypothetical protein